MELANQAGDRTDTQTHAQETEPMVPDYFCFSSSSISAINSIPFPPSKHSLCTGDCQEVKKSPLGPEGASFLSLCPSRRHEACGAAAFDDFLCCFSLFLGRGGAEWPRKLVEALLCTDREQNPKLGQR